MTDEPWEVANADPITAPLWAAARRHELLLERCVSCGHHQHHPRGFCLRCQGDVAWVAAGGGGTVYAQTEIHMRGVEGLEPPYICALVTLDEGPRVTTNLTRPCATGARVELAWRERSGDAPPLPVFGPDGAS